VGPLTGWRYCPRCAAELSVGADRVECSACGFVAYAHSAPTVSALCVDGAGRLLLARRAVDPERGKWDLPGGFLEEGEPPLDGLRRELREEAGVEVEPLDFVGVWVDRYGAGPDAAATLNLYWTARILDGEPHPDDDVAEFAWFDPDALPPSVEFAFPNVHEAIRTWRTGRTGES
jgi:ADP-ribose pyrophosphatase YjhB (NUDIX family)